MVDDPLLRPIHMFVKGFAGFLCIADTSTKIHRGHSRFYAMLLLHSLTKVCQQTREEQSICRKKYSLPLIE